MRLDEWYEGWRREEGNKLLKWIKCKCNGHVMLKKMGLCMWCRERKVMG